MTMRIPFPIVRLGWALLPALASAQIAYKEAGLISAARSALPSEGPAAARGNPARLAEVRLASLAYGRFSAVSDKGGAQFLQAAVGLPWDELRWPVGLAVGLGYMNHGTAIDGSNGIFEEAEYDPGIAVRFPSDPASVWSVSAGATFAIHQYNAFDAFRSRSLGIDAGTLARVDAGMGRFDFGCAYHGVKSPRVRLPRETGGDYAIPGWIGPSLGWISAADRVHAHLGFFINEPQDAKDGPSSGPMAGVDGWDIEYRPIPWLGLKAERPRLASNSMLGVIGRPPVPWEHGHAFIELDMGHDRFGPAHFLPFLFGDPGEDEGRGFLLALSLGAEI